MSWELWTPRKPRSSSVCGTSLGQRAERIIQECERLNSMFALSLRPTPPKPSTKQKLLDMVNAAMLAQGKKVHPE